VKRVLTIILGLGTALLAVSCGTESAKPRPVRIAAVFSASLDDPWTAALHQALLRGQEDLGTAYVWSAAVPPERFESLVRDYIARGYEMITGDCFGVEGAARALARENQKTYFCFGSDLGAVSPNFAVLEARLEEPAFLCGTLAAGMTRSAKIGVVAAFPSPAINRIVNAFARGAGGRAEVLVEYTGSRYEITHEPEAAAVERLVRRGADVIFTERPWAIKACERLQIPVFGCYGDLSSFSPLVVVSGAIWEPAPLLVQAVRMAREGQFLPLNLGAFSSLPMGGAYLAPIRGRGLQLPGELVGSVNQLQREIREGRLRVPAEESPFPAP